MPNNTTQFFSVRNNRSGLDENVFKEDWKDTQGEYQVRRLNADTAEMLCDNIVNNPSSHKLKIIFRTPIYNFHTFL